MSSWVFASTPFRTSWVFSPVRSRMTPSTASSCFLIAELAQPRRDADGDAADVLDQHRHAVVHRQDDVADVLQGLQPAQAAHVVELPALE